MESTFISKENIDNIYNYLNTKTVREYNVNLDSNEKYKKIVKKLTKTIFKSLNVKIKNMTINEFNELVVSKSLPFIKKNIDNNKLKNIDYQNVESNNSSNMFEKPINYLSVTGNELNIDLNKSLKLVNETHNSIKTSNKKTKMNKKQKLKDNEYDSYLKDILEFENLVKQSNNKIKNNFKDLVKNSQNNFVKSCEGEDVDKFIMNRCIAKDDVVEKGLSKSAFEEIVENKTININRDEKLMKLNNFNQNNGGNNNQNNGENNNQNNGQEQNNYPTSAISNTNINNSNIPTTSSQENTLVDYYDKNEMNFKNLFTEILINQKDNSKNNKIESYEGETYLPNLIANYGEEAPIQPLLYQNTNKGSEIINNYSIIIDTGDDNGYKLTTDTYNNVVTLTGTNLWQKFRVNLEDTFQIDKITDVYLKSFSLIGATTMNNCMFFVLDIEEFNLRSYSNNPHLKSKIVIQNNISTDGAVFSKSYSKFSNYLTTITPSNYTTLNFELTNENGKGADDDNDKTFKANESKTNRIIFELDFVARKPKDPIFDYSITKDTLNSSS